MAYITQALKLSYTKSDQSPIIDQATSSSISQTQEKATFSYDLNMCTTKDIKVIQRRTIYVISIPKEIATEEMLTSNDYFGQYGQISKIIINRKQFKTMQNPTVTVDSENYVSAYITYVEKLSADQAIIALESTILQNLSQIRASYGLTSYCKFFIRRKKCRISECSYYHVKAPKNECIFSYQSQTNSEVFNLQLKFAFDFAVENIDALLAIESNDANVNYSSVLPNVKTAINNFRLKCYSYGIQIDSVQNTNFQCRDEIHSNHNYRQENLSQDQCYGTYTEVNQQSMPHQISYCEYDNWQYYQQQNDNNGEYSQNYPSNNCYQNNGCNNNTYIREDNHYYYPQEFVSSSYNQQVDNYYQSPMPCANSHQDQQATPDYTASYEEGYGAYSPPYNSTNSPSYHSSYGDQQYQYPSNQTSYNVTPNYSGSISPAPVSWYSKLKDFAVVHEQSNKIKVVQQEW